MCILRVIESNLRKTFPTISWTPQHIVHCCIPMKCHIYPSESHPSHLLMLRISCLFKKNHCSSQKTKAAVSRCRHTEFTQTTNLHCESILRSVTPEPQELWNATGTFSSSLDRRQVHLPSRATWKQTSRWKQVQAQLSADLLILCHCMQLLGCEL